MNRIECSFENRVYQSKKRLPYESKTKKKTKKSNICINVAETHYSVVKEVAKKLKWNLCTDPIYLMNFDICWTDNHVRPQIYAKMQENQKINHFPGMSILSRKNNLGKNLMNFAKVFPYQYNFFPITWSLPADYADLKQYHQNRKQGKAQTFIVKPQAGCQGRGIYLTRNIQKLKLQRCVVQRYMHKPFLIDGLKFDLRIYVLIAGIDPFRIYVYEEGLARFATQPYCLPRTDNLDNKFMHLTNYAINKDHPNFIFNQTIQNCDVGHKRSLTSLYRLLQKQGHNVIELKEKINDIFIKTLITGYPTLSRSLHQSHPNNFSNDMCFQVLGFDIILDYKLNPYLLEINYTPSFTTDTPLDHHIKSHLIFDTICLLNITPLWKKQIKMSDRAQTQERIVSGKRRKYQQKQRIQKFQQAAQKRDEYEQKNLNKFSKIFADDKKIEEYIPFYDLAQKLYQQQHKQSNLASPYFYPLYRFYKKNEDNDKMNKQSKRMLENSSIFLPKERKSEAKTVNSKRNINSAKPSKNISQQSCLQRKDSQRLFELRSSLSPREQMNKNIRKTYYVQNFMEDQNVQVKKQ